MTTQQARRAPKNDLIESRLAAARQRVEHLRLLIYGPSFSGKSMIGCRLPSCLILDLDQGLDWYRRRFSVTPVQCKDFDDLQTCLDALIQDTRGYRTIFIDGLDRAWKNHCKQWEGRFLQAKPEHKGGHHGDWFEMQMLDWGPVKSSWDAFTHRMKNIAANLIITARAKNELEKVAGGGRAQFPKIIGQTYDLPANFLYEVDAVVELTDPKTRKGRGIYGTVRGKDRTARFPSGEFQITLEALVKWFGEAVIGRPTRPPEEEAPPEPVERPAGDPPAAAPETQAPETPAAGAPAAGTEGAEADPAAGARDRLVAELVQLSKDDYARFRENVLGGHDPMKLTDNESLDPLEVLREGSWRNR